MTDSINRRSGSAARKRRWIINSRSHAVAIALALVGLGTGTQASAQGCSGISPDVEIARSTAAAESARDHDQLSDPSGGQRLSTGGTVTEIVVVRNNTPCVIQLRKGEAPGEIIELQPGGRYAGAFWVPWQDNANDGKAAYITFNGVPLFTFWQRRGHVYYEASRNLPGGFDAAPEIPGMSEEGGRRVLHVGRTLDGVPYIKMAGAR